MFEKMMQLLALDALLLELEGEDIHIKGEDLSVKQGTTECRN